MASGNGHLLCSVFKTKAATTCQTLALVILLSVGLCAKLAAYAVKAVHAHVSFKYHAEQ